MYTGRLGEPIDAEATITLLCLADRFAISSCMEPLAKVLKRFPSTLNDCLLLLGLPESLKSDRAVQPVVEHCRTYLAQQFQNITMKKGDFLSLSIEGVKVVLDSDAPMVKYEEDVFQIALDWLEVNCHRAEQKPEVAVEVMEVIRFPWMTGDFLMDDVSPNPHMSEACRALVTEALEFKSSSHSRQQEMLGKKTNHNRYRPRNNTILENFWGKSKTSRKKHPDGSCQVFFEFPLELVICTGQSFQSLPFDLCDQYTFYLEAYHSQVKNSYNQQLTCFINLVLEPSCKSPRKLPDRRFVEYTVAMKRDYSQNYDTKTSGSFDLKVSGAPEACIVFSDFFSGWFIEQGSNFPRWNVAINGPVFLRVDLQLKTEDNLTCDNLKKNPVLSVSPGLNSPQPHLLKKPDAVKPWSQLRF